MSEDAPLASAASRPSVCGSMRSTKKRARAVLRTSTAVASSRAGTAAAMRTHIQPKETRDRKSTRLELQSLMRISYAVFCLKQNTDKHAVGQHDTRPEEHTTRLHPTTRH